MPIDTLCLDAGGVLVFPNWKRISEVLARYGVHGDPDAFAAADPHVKHEIDVIHASASDAQRGADYFERVLARAGIELGPATEAALRDLRQYHDKQNLWEIVPEDVIPALDRLRALGLRLVVISNANGTLRTAFSRLGLTSHFDVLLDSHEEGIEKPDPRLFHRALERAGSNTATALHVGDMYSVDVLGARAAGLHAVLLDPANLYASRDCTRVRSLDELADQLLDGKLP